MDRGLARKCKHFDTERFIYLAELKKEFLSSQSNSAKLETLSNLANFAYNPENYQHLYDLEVHELFLNNLAFSELDITVASIKGIINLVSYTPIAEFVCHPENINKLVSVLKENTSDEITYYVLFLFAILKHNHNLVQSSLDPILEILPNYSSKSSRIGNISKYLISDSSTAQ